MKISIEDLEVIMLEHRGSENWKAVLKNGYSDNELYFEFGLYPKKRNLDNSFIIIINHHFNILVEDNDKNHGIGYNILITSSKYEIIDNNHFIIESEMFEDILKECLMIYNQYKRKDNVCFWSIPNKWFQQTKLIQFLEKNLVIANIKNEGRGSWYYP